MNKFYKILIFIFIINLFWIKDLSAAKLYFEVYKDDVIAEDFLVNLMLDTEGELLNAIEGRLLFPEGSIEIKEINEGNSSINFWVDRPHIVNDNEIIFSGITPGGFVGKDKLIFATYLHQRSSNISEIKIDNIKILKNDGEGGEVRVDLSSLPLPLSSELSISKPKDTDPPEDFIPEILQNSDLFDGKPTLIFATQDKNSGIDHYEIRKGYFGKFINIESPFVLENDYLNSKLFIKAIDNAKNEVIIGFNPPDYKPWYERYGIIVIILLIITLYFKRKTWLNFVK